LLVGVAAAKSLAYVLDVPLIGVNHLEGHVEAAFLERPELEPPVIALIVSGGHTMITALPEHGRFEVLGSTIDDAAGEAFDKIARFIGLGFPGGPVIDKLAQGGDPKAYKFPRAMMNDDSYDFSYSGLKTAVIRWIREQHAAGNDIDAEDLAASFQEAIVDVQVAKTLRAAEDRRIGTVIVVGGVAANSRLRARMAEEGTKRGLTVVTPSISLCTDNGVMIAAAGMRRLALGESTPLDVSANPNMALA
jgi:N6-L-threonylcarbamoyladenine synthase